MTGARTLLDLRMHDDSRHFVSLAQTRSWYAVRDHVGRLEGAVLEGFLTDHVTEAWIDFTFSGHRFSVNDQLGDYWFFVTDPACPDAVLATVAEHFAALLEPDSPTSESGGLEGEPDGIGGERGA